MVPIPKPTSEMCIRCKSSRMLCGKPRCPLLLKYRSLLPVRRVIADNEVLTGPSPPSLFVGRFGYPKIRVSPMAPPFNVVEDNLPIVRLMDEPDRWYGTSIDQICQWRSQLIRNVIPELIDVRWVDKNPILQSSRELVMAKEPVDIESHFEKKGGITFQLRFDRESQPMGPSVRIKKLSLTTNPSIEHAVDKTVSDTDLFANEGVSSLYTSGITVTQISRILSAGLLGVEKSRKLVPTRWSITATDDIVGRKLITQIKDYPEISESMLFFSNYLDNHFAVLLLPRCWSFENNEAWFPGSVWNPDRSKEVSIYTDTEFFSGRSKYAHNTVGAYYAARLAVLEYLLKVRRQASAVILREVHSGYYIPLGVWQIRENVRFALKEKPLTFSDINDSLLEAQKHLVIPIQYWVHNSELLKKAMYQKSLFEYL
ncbi:MAG: Nre family DNA repair protein [Candidatus Hodarchaeota archaeon]